MAKKRKKNPAHEVIVKLIKKYYKMRFMEDMPSVMVDGHLLALYEVLSEMIIPGKEIARVIKSLTDLIKRTEKESHRPPDIKLQAVIDELSGLSM